MSEMKLWAARDNDGSENLIRRTSSPSKNGGHYPNGCGNQIVSFSNETARLACMGVAAGKCREIKTLDLINWTVEYVPDPPTLKEAWKAYRGGGMVYSSGTRYGNLIEALQREFPDE